MSDQDVKNNVQPEGAVPEGTVSADDSAGTTPSPDAKTDQIQSLSQEAIAKMIQDAVAPIKEVTARNIQSVKDKAAAEIDKANRRAGIAEITLNQIRGRLKESNPEFATELEISELRTRDQHYQQRDLEDQARQQQTQFEQSFKTNLNQFVTELGVDPGDKRIDWGDDAPNYLERQGRILNSVAKIQKAEAGKALESVNQQIKDAETRLRKELGLDSVDTSHSVGSKIPDDKKTADDWIKEGLADKQKKK
jgi:uncharacterized membrane-anchored protein YjiN (DUF445 family)